MAVNASVLIAREGNTTVMKMSHVPKYFYVVYVYTVRFACIPDLPYTSWVTKVSVPIKIINQDSNRRASVASVKYLS